MSPEAIRKWQRLGMVLTGAAGTLLHFVYDWSGRAAAAGIFGTVNESTWEHLKLLFWPMLLFFAVLYLAGPGRRTPCFAAASARAVWRGMLVITVFFYTYTSILGRNFAPLDIVLFFAGVTAAYRLWARLLEDPPENCRGRDLLGWAALAVLAVCFVYFTAAPPKIGLFRDPVNGGFGPGGLG